MRTENTSGIAGAERAVSERGVAGRRRPGKRTGVLLINLGTPDSASFPDVYRYLTEFLNDPRVIDISPLGRFFLVNFIIIPFRARNSTRIYKQLFDLNNGVAPLLEYGIGLRDALRERLSSEGVSVELAMRYGEPSLDEVCARMEKEVYDEIVVLPLFPQYASSSTGSALEKALRFIRNWYVVPEIKVVSSYHDHPGYIETMVRRARKYDVDSYDHVLFSYHGLPDRQIFKTYPKRECYSGCDCTERIHGENYSCYLAQCYSTSRLLAARLGIPEDKYTVAFQSRLDKEWIEPFSDKVVIEQAAKGAKRMLAFSPAFVADCLETTIEIGDEYLELFREHGGETLDLVESLNLHPLWIDTVEDLIRGQMAEGLVERPEPDVRS